jgi:hypothetical protein
MSEPSEIPVLREVRAKFASSDQMQEAVGQLNMSGFDRAEISLPATGEGAPLSEQSEPASTDEDAQQMRTLGVSTAASVAALAAAGITVATGGAALPAVAAAVAAGGAVGGADFAVHHASDKAEQQDRNARAAQGELLLVVRTSTDAKRSQAESILRSAGATSVETVN